MDFFTEIVKLIDLKDITKEEIAQTLVVSADTSKGDFCLPCFRFAKKLRQVPQQIADSLRDSIKKPDYVKDIQSVAGYLNFYIDRDVFARQILDEALSDPDNYGSSSAGKGKTIVIDYSSVNIAKPLHIGHLSSTAIGSALCKIFRKLGYKVVGVNHLGDWGTQFGKLISAYKRWGNDEDIKNRKLRALVDLYVRFHKEAEENPKLDDEGRAWFKKIENGDAEALEIFDKFKEITLSEVDKIYKRLGVTFDSYAGESFYIDKMQPVIDKLEEKKLLSDSEGAKVVNLDEFGLPPCLILKSDGASIYATRDLAAAFYRKNTYDFYKCLYVVAYQQNLHFQQIFKVLELMGCSWAKDMEHIAFGMVSLESGSIKTRKGNFIFLEDVLDEAVNRTREIIRSKGTKLDNEDEVAESIGVGAVVFSAVSNSRIKDIVFSYDKILSFEGESGPYLQYTFARTNSVLKKGEISDYKADYSLLTDETGYSLIKTVGRFPSVIMDSAERREPYILTRYLIDLAQEFNKFYIDNKILSEDKELTKARLALTKAVSCVIKNGLELLGIKAPEKM